MKKIVSMLLAFTFVFGFTLFGINEPNKVEASQNHSIGKGYKNVGGGVTWEIWADKSYQSEYSSSVTASFEYYQNGSWHNGPTKTFKLWQIPGGLFGKADYTAPSGSTKVYIKLSNGQSNIVKL